MIILAGLLLRVYAGLDSFLHPWDERYHALVAKNMIENPFFPRLYKYPLLPFDYKDWTANYIWVHKQPLALWLMALSLKVFGISEFAVRIPSILLSTAAIYLTYRITLFFFSEKRLALIAAFLHSIHGFTIALAAGRTPVEHIDSAFIFFIELGVFFSILFFSQKERYRLGYAILIGLAMGLAILTKWLPGLIVFPIWVSLALHERFKIRQILYYSAVIIPVVTVVALPWQLYILQAFPLEAEWEFAYNRMHLFLALESHSHPWYYHFNRLRMNFGELVFLPVLWFSWKAFRKVTSGNYQYLALFLWFWVPFVFFTIAATKMQAYTMISAPAVFIIIAWFWEYLFRIKDRLPYTWAVVIVLFLLLALPVRQSIKRIKRFDREESTFSWVKQRKELPGIIDLPADKVVLLGEDHPVETMFYTGFTAYLEIPDEAVMDSLERNGYFLFINNGKDYVRRGN